jgi:hypothetical protein
MNKYEILFDEIFHQTNEGVIRWRQVRRTENSELVFNPNIVFRQFEAEFFRNDNRFTLLLMEKKFEDPEHDFAYEAYRPEILVLDDNKELVATLTDSLIERHKLIYLASIVEGKSDNASKLFGPDD